MRVFAATPAGLAAHLLATLRVREIQRYLPPLTKLALAYDSVIERIEIIKLYALPP
jgi:hypothetical protein